MPLQGVRSPTNTSGNFMGRMTASWITFLAWSSPATSSHFTFGFSLTIASDICPCISFCSLFCATCGEGWLFGADGPVGSWRLAGSGALFFWSCASSAATVFLMPLSSSFRSGSLPDICSTKAMLVSTLRWLTSLRRHALNSSASCPLEVVSALGNSLRISRMRVTAACPSLAYILILTAYHPCSLLQTITGTPPSSPAL